MCLGLPMPTLGDGSASPMKALELLYAMEFETFMSSALWHVRVTSVVVSSNSPTPSDTEAFPYEFSIVLLLGWLVSVDRSDVVSGPSWWSVIL